MGQLGMIMYIKWGGLSLQALVRNGLQLEALLKNPHQLTLLRREALLITLLLLIQLVDLEKVMQLKF